MNKKGFTLVELLCVIAILALLTVIASSNVVKLSRKGNTSLYCTKVTMIEALARDYGLKYEAELNNSTVLYNGYKSMKIKVQDLVDSNKIETDRDGQVISPYDSKSMNNVDIILYLKNNRIYAIIENNVC